METEELKPYCGHCHIKMKDYGTYLKCESGLCSVAVSTHAYTTNTASLYKYQLSGDIIIK